MTPRPTLPDGGIEMRAVSVIYPQTPETLVIPSSTLASIEADTAIAVSGWKTAETRNDALERENRGLRLSLAVAVRSLQDLTPLMAEQKHRDAYGRLTAAMEEILKTETER